LLGGVARRFIHAVFRKSNYKVKNTVEVPNPADKTFDLREFEEKTTLTTIAANTQIT
jgi:hypothetical protein